MPRGALRRRLIRVETFEETKIRRKRFCMYHSNAWPTTPLWSKRPFEYVRNRHYVMSNGNTIRFVANKYSFSAVERLHHWTQTSDRLAPSATNDDVVIHQQ
ncbi:hypothetical protein EVAR_54959_1 [Eumeta japonica]|uniref:Uncharacterized protein n=1 Tax=Eumeta variegata TaxID=151549 RepID=A0A4C1YMY5_EUMVA|nr:hypothetical protein EVAR_54959_1 [Eumeta japonica]